MLFVLSPAKSLDYASPLRSHTHTDPLFVKQSQQLIKVLRTYPPPQISELMDLSDTLAGLNVARYQAWRAKATPQNARQAVLAFDGDVYDGLNAREMDDAALDWAQAHVCVLSFMTSHGKSIRLSSTTAKKVHFRVIERHEGEGITIKYLDTYLDW